ncbi:hypothetical protein JCM6882_004668 [Rhodosporidiobolus microsporus]
MRRYFLVLAALAESCSSVLAAPPPLAVQWWFTNQTLYRSSEDADCDPVPFVIYGRNTPFDLSVVRSPFDPTSLAAQEVLQVLSSTAGTGNFSWVPTVEAGTEIALRVVDAAENVEYSQVRPSQKAKDANAAQKRHEKAMTIGLAVGLPSVVYLPILALFLFIVYEEVVLRWRRSAGNRLRRLRDRCRRQKNPDVETAVVVPHQAVAGTVVCSLIPLKAARGHGSPGGQPVERQSGNLSRASSRAPSYTSSLLPVYEAEDAPVGAPR